MGSPKKKAKERGNRCPTIKRSSGRKCSKASKAFAASVNAALQRYGKDHRAVQLKDYLQHMKISSGVKKFSHAEYQLLKRHYHMQKLQYARLTPSARTAIALSSKIAREIGTPTKSFVTFWARLSGLHPSVIRSLHVRPGKTPASSSVAKCLPGKRHTCLRGRAVGKDERRAKSVLTQKAVSRVRKALQSPWLCNQTHEFQHCAVRRMHKGRLTRSMRIALQVAASARHN